MLVVTSTEKTVADRAGLLADPKEAPPPWAKATSDQGDSREDLENDVT